MLIFAQTLRTN